MTTFQLLIDPSVIDDLQKAIDYYESKKSGLGKLFMEAIELAFDSLSKFPFYQIRYDTIRCYPLTNYPYMIHFIVNENEKTIEIRAVIHMKSNFQK